MKNVYNKKTHIGDIEPNPKEFGIWIKNDGTTKVYDHVKQEWQHKCDNTGGEELNYVYYKISTAADYETKTTMEECGALFSGVNNNSSTEPQFVHDAPISLLDLDNCIWETIVFKVRINDKITGIQFNNDTGFGLISEFSSHTMLEQMPLYPKLEKATKADYDELYNQFKQQLASAI